MEIFKIFEAIFNRYRNPSETVLVVEEAAHLSMPAYTYSFIKHRLHQELALCFMRAADDSHCEVWLFGNSSKNRLSRLAANENSAQLTDIPYRIGFHANDGGHRGFYDKSVNDKGRTNGDWPACYMRAKAELCAELATLLEEDFQRNTEREALERIGETPSPDQRYVPQKVNQTDAKVLIILVGESPMGRAAYDFADLPFITGSAQESATGGFISFPPLIPLSKEKAAVIGVPAANLICALADVGGIENILTRPQGITLTTRTRASLNHTEIGKLIAESFGYTRHALYDAVHKEPL